MTPGDYAALLDRALGEPHGLKLTFANGAEVLSARRRLYKLRDQRRESGDIADQIAKQLNGRQFPESFYATSSKDLLVHVPRLRVGSHSIR